ncbi:hypothetical protein SCLCIDRAFT_154700 [Scleroderma citrinum Foug A]|uniref:Uncharacterized protein n=1 Tax=Scleroderma citrinum Foug A TaxID=1036808 RepID=A0A0C3ERX1_9AGAM|nr:hypothetical protein SCLCIDRAFT_154700 [Scleroderma citrinum Foug A]
MLPHGRLVVDYGRFRTHGRFISYNTLFPSQALGSFLPLVDVITSVLNRPSLSITGYLYL